MTSGPGNPSYVWTNNVLVPGFTSTTAGGSADSGNVNPATIAGEYATSPATFVVTGATPAVRSASVAFADQPDGDFSLALSSPFKFVASDGSAVGYDKTALDIAQGAVSGVTVNAGATQVIVKFTAPNATGCPVDLSSNRFATWSRTNDPGGKRGRQIVINGLTAGTAYQYRILCQSTKPSGAFTTKPSGGDAAAISINLDPPASASVDHVVIQSGATQSLGNATSAEPCASGCTVSVPALAAEVLYYQVQYFDASDTLLAQSSIGAAVP